MTESLDRRYLHIAGAVAAGGWFPGTGPKKVNVPMPTVASLHLPIVGGRAVAEERDIQVDCRNLDLGDISPEERKKLEGKILMRLESGRSELATIPRMSPSDPAQSFTRCEFTGLTMDGLSVKHGLLNLSLVHAGDEPYPHIRFGETKIVGLTLDGNEIQVTFDLTTFNEFDTLKALDDAYRLGKLPRHVANTLTLAQREKARVADPTPYVVGTIVSKIEGALPKGAMVQNDGYTIDWPDFGKIRLGEITMNNNLRRVTLLRIQRCEGEHGSGCSGGNYYP